MKIVSIKNTGEANALKQAVAVLRSGGVVVYPTDTAYALGGIYSNTRVRKKIMEIKGRKDEKFTLIASSASQAEKFFPFTAKQKKIARALWPSPLSLVVTSQFAVRVPNQAFARKLARAAGAPLVATSANVSGGHNPYSALRTAKAFSGKDAEPDMIIDAGILLKVQPSAVVRVLHSGEIEIIRKGPRSIMEEMRKFTFRS